MNTETVGVVVGRFQATQLHAGHRDLIEHVAAHHDHVLLVIGCAAVPLRIRNPLDFQTRKVMLQELYPNATIVRLDDVPCDHMWSQQLDALIEAVFPGKTTVLYGSRDSFIKYYHGANQCQYFEPLPEHQHLNGTDARAAIGVINSPEFRAGVIYAANKPFLTSYQVVDVAVLNETRQKVLLGKKPHDKEKYRFLGGFVDPADASLERAAKREVFEETSGMETDGYTYVGSARINDWRYRGDRDQVMSSFFVAEYIFGKPIPSDDITELTWVDLSQLTDVLIDEHSPLAEMLMQHEITTER